MCNITSVWYLVNAISCTTMKATYFGFFIRFNLALGSFGKEGNVLVRISMSPISIISSSFADILQKNFLKFFSFLFLFIFSLFAVKQICFEFIWNTSVKKNKQTNERTNKAKQKAANSVYFFSITLQFSVYFCLFYLTQNKEGENLNFLSLLNDVIFSRAHSDLNHKIKVPITTTGGSLFINAKKFRITYFNQKGNWVHRKIVFLSAPHNKMHYGAQKNDKNSLFKLKLINTINHSPEWCTWNNRITLQSSK